MPSKSAMFRAALSKKDVLRLVGAHNGLGARLIDQHGFDGVWASGFEISTSQALPDANILTMSEFLAAAVDINNACSLPVLADCDTGFGNSNNAMHMVRRYEAAGIAGVCIEDKKFPKVNSYVPGRQELAPIGDFVGKIMSAKAAQVSEDFVVVARVEALIAGWGQEEAMKRAKAYADAGADMILMHSKADTDREVREFLGNWNKRLPVVIVPTTYPEINFLELSEAGVKVVIYANHGLRAAVKATNNVLAKIAREDGIAGLTDEDIVPMSMIFDLQGMTRMKEIEKEFLSKDKAVFLAAGAPNNESLSPVLGDRPVAMLDINGKSLLLRNVETLNACGIQDISVVGGYRIKAIVVEGIKVIENPDYRTTGTAESLLCVDSDQTDRLLVVYGDVIVDKHLVRRIMETKEDIVLVADDSFRKLEERTIDFMILDNPSDAGIRKVDTGTLSSVRKIGNGVTLEEATHEFVGVAVMTADALRKTSELAAKKGNADKLALPDMLGRLAEQGMSLKALVVNSGWKEIHTFQDYREACVIMR